MPCGNCKKTKGLLSVSILDLSPDTMTIVEREFCLSCLKQSGFYCEPHQEVNFLVYDPSEDGEASFDEIPVMFACLSCCRERAFALPVGEYEQYTMLLHGGHCSEGFLTGLTSLVDLLEGAPLPAERRVIFGAILMSEFFNTTVQETVTDLAVYSADAVRN